MRRRPARAALGSPQTPDILEQASDPAVLRAMSPQTLPGLCELIRTALAGEAHRHAQDLESALGVVELTVALHRVFRPPRDTIVFDCANHARAHTVLTSRHAAWARPDAPIPPEPPPAGTAGETRESTRIAASLAYADGLAKAHRLRGQTDRAVVAVIGDRALASGLAWEGLNHLATADLPVVVVINDNGSSGAAATGGIGMHLRTLQAAAGRAAECHTCGAGAVAGNAFTDLGVGYLGPIDGHDVAACERALRIARELNRPVVVHFITRDGQGQPPTGKGPHHRMRRVAVLPAAAAQPNISHGQAWAEALAAEICAIAAERDDLVAVTAAGPTSAGLGAFAERFPERVFDVGDAAQQGVCSAAGLAIGGLRPLLALHAAHLSRTFDQILNDVALPRLPVTVVLAADSLSATQRRGGRGAWDLSMLRVLPALAVAAPRDPARLRDLLREAIDHTEGPTVVRLPRSSTAGTDIDAIDQSHRADILYRSRSSRRDLLLVAVGTLAAPCVEAARIIDHAGIGVTVVDPRWVIPINPVLPRLLAHHRLGVTVEDNDRAAGIGALLAHTCADEGVRTPIQNLGLPHGLIEPRDQRDLPTGAADLSAQAIASAALRTLMAARHETPPHHTAPISSSPGT